MALLAGGAAAGAVEKPGAPKLPTGVSIVVDPTDQVGNAPPVRRALVELQQALTAAKIRVRTVESVSQAPADDLCIVAAGGSLPLAGELIKAQVTVPAPGAAEDLAVVPTVLSGKRAVLASGGGPRGLAYALLELADRVRFSGHPIAKLVVGKPATERPANRIRSIARCFESDMEDKPWFYDRAMWPQYFSMLATQRFNRFSLTLGLGYNFPRNVRDVYFYFAYPFLVSPPGYKVRAVGLPAAERERNLETLRFISDEAAACGLDFQLGIWTHAYQWADSPNANYTIEGLTPENHAAYCRDALYAVLEACPAITGVTFRIHGESGIPEGSYDFWKTVFEGIVRTGRRIEIDMHAKGMDQKTIDVALATGLPVVISPKYWAEHQGLPYHQAAIRELEMPPEKARDEGFMALSSGSRRFLRYGYGDLLKEGRRYGVLHRIWPGTQRALLWGDPAIAAGYGRSSSFCGSDGVELCEPLSFKGRMGSGLPGGRCAYADASLQPKYDWEKYLYTYRVWGRLIYNPDADTDGWRRASRKQLEEAAPAAEAGLASASRILPLITTAHGASASNNSFWPEMYTNMPIVDAGRKHPYGDTPAPKRFGTVSPFDPELFSRIDDFADELLQGKRSGKISPLEWARWLDDCAQAAAQHFAEAEKTLAGEQGAEFRRWQADAAIQAGVGRFFAWKVRSAVLFAMHERTGDRQALQEAVKAYRAARAAWAEFAGKAGKVYAADITYGTSPHLRGHWLDRLPEIDADIADMERRLAPAPASAGGSPARIGQAIREVLALPRQPTVSCYHAPPERFKPGQELPIELAILMGNRPSSVQLHYRRVNQAERYHVAEMVWKSDSYLALIPADYTNSPYPLQYFFELHDGAHIAWLYPGFDATLSNQPYYVVRHGA
jgi:hypothetical protein